MRPEQIRTPDDHRWHTTECGCAIFPANETLAVCECGAAYVLSDVETFPRWRCYDCGMIHITGKRMWIFELDRDYPPIPVDASGEGE